MLAISALGKDKTVRYWLTELYGLYDEPYYVWKPTMRNLKLFEDINTAQDFWITHKFRLTDDNNVNFYSVEIMELQFEPKGKLGFIMPPPVLLHN